MKNKWTSSLLQSITQGQLKGPQSWTATTFTHDSRQVTPGQLYVAIKGEKVDGHDYIHSALQNGAVAALVSHIPAGLSSDAPLVLVPNVEQALLQVGRYVRDHLKATVIGVTGSSGKTTTKDMLKLCLSSQGKTHANFRSFNSRWGVPLTLAECEGDEQFVVLEMGMSAAGELGTLTHMARPHIAIITTINPAHLEELGSLENIARAKAEIFQGLPSTGTTLVPGDVEHTPLLLAKAHESAAAHVVVFGESPAAQIRLLSYQPQSTQAQVTISLQGTEYSYSLAVLGKHYAMNSLAVLGAIHAAKASVPQAIEALQTFQGSDRRGQIIPLSQGILLFDESYNANPGSMKAALEAFGSHPVSGHKILVLGDMRALGRESRDYHLNLKETVLATHPHVVFTYGAEMEALHQALAPHLTTHHFQDLGSLSQAVMNALQPHDAVFIKASNSVHLNQVAQAILNQFFPSA